MGYLFVKSVRYASNLMYWFIILYYYICKFYSIQISLMWVYGCFESEAID